MSAEVKKEIQLEIAHVLFMDIVGYSKRLINEQRALRETLNQIVRNTEQFRDADASSTLIKSPTGDGMALVFRRSPEEPVKCALEISKQLRKHPELRVRMGIHSGPVNEITDLNEQANIAGAGINMMRSMQKRNYRKPPNYSMKLSPGTRSSCSPGACSPECMALCIGLGMTAPSLVSI